MFSRISGLSKLAVTAATSKPPSASPVSFASLESMCSTGEEALRAAPSSLVSRMNAVNAVRDTERLLETATAGLAIRSSLVSAPPASISPHVEAATGEGLDLTKTMGEIGALSQKLGAGSH